MPKLESVFINNDLFKTNNEGTAILSQDGKELIYVISRLRSIEIPEGVYVVKRHAFLSSSINGRLEIPASVEIIEDYAWHCCYGLKVIEFENGSRLRSLRKVTLPRDLKQLIINNEHFKTKSDRSVICIDTQEEVFVPDLRRRHFWHLK